MNTGNSRDLGMVSEPGPEVDAEPLDLKPTSSQLLWILDVYGFLLAGFLDTLGGADAAADQLPGPLGAGLLEAAREAFTQGLHGTPKT